MEKQPTQQEDVQLVLDRLARWEQEGILENLEGVLKATNALLDIMTPEIVENAVQMIAGSLELADTMAHCKVLPIVSVLRDMKDLLRNPPIPQKHQLRHLWRELHDPDVKNGLELALGLLKIVGKRISMRAIENSSKVANDSAASAS